MKIFLLILVLVLLDACLWGSVVDNFRKIRDREEGTKLRAIYKMFWKERRVTLCAAVILWGVCIVAVNDFLPLELGGKMSNMAAQATLWVGRFAPLVGIAVIAVNHDE